MNRITLLSAVLAMAVMTAGCGLKGDLYIPDEDRHTVQSTTIAPGPAADGSAAEQGDAASDAAAPEAAGADAPDAP